MTQNFLRYSPDVEQTEPDFDKTLQTVLDDMKQHMRGSLKTEGIGLMVRNGQCLAPEEPKIYSPEGYLDARAPEERNGLTFRFYGARARTRACCYKYLASTRR